MACIEKLNVMNSQIGRRPAIAAPTAIPANPISVIGVSITRLSPYFFHKPRETCFKYNNNEHFLVSREYYKYVYAHASIKRLCNDNKMQQSKC